MQNSNHDDVSKRESKKNLKFMIYVCFKQYSTILKYDKSFGVVWKDKQESH
jgi:hypothetical protein